MLFEIHIKVVPATKSITLIPVAALVEYMARNVTAGHQSLRQSEHFAADYTKTHDIVAVSPEGEHLWVTDSCYERETVSPEVKLADDYSHLTNVVIDGQQVSHFELVEV